MLANTLSLSLKRLTFNLLTISFSFGKLFHYTILSKNLNILFRIIIIWRLIGHHRNTVYTILISAKSEYKGVVILKRG